MNAAQEFIIMSTRKVPSCSGGQLLDLVSIQVKVKKVKEVEYD